MSQTTKRQAPAPERRFLTYAQVAAMLSYASRQGVWRAWRRGDLPAPVRVGGVVRFDERAILDALDAKKAAAA